MFFSVPFHHGECISFSYLIPQKYTGDNAAIQLLLNSAIFKFDIKLDSHRRLIPAHNKGKPHSYYIIDEFVLCIFNWMLLKVYRIICVT